MKTTLLFLAIYVVSLCSGQHVSTFPGTVYTAFGSFDMHDDHVAISGSCNQYWYSSDLGQNWTTTDLDNSAYDVALVEDNKKALLAIFRDLILIDNTTSNKQSLKSSLDSLDPGIIRFIETSGDFVYLLDGKGIIKGQSGTYEWERVFRDTVDGIVRSAQLIGDALYYGNQSGDLFRHSISTGETSKVFNFGGSVRDIAMTSDLYGYMTTAGVSKMIKTTDGWATYTELDGMPENINPKAFGTDILISVNTNRFYVSTDGGQSSEFVKTDTGRNFDLIYDAQYSDDGTLYMIGRSSLFAKSDDNG